MHRTLGEWEKFLNERPKNELVDIIIRRLMQDPAFKRILDNKYGSEDISAQEAICEFKGQIANEMAARNPDTSVMRSTKDSFMEKMEAWPVYDYCVGCLAIMRVFDGALAEGAGMNDGTDDELGMDIEHASECAANAVKSEPISDADMGRLLAYLEEEAKVPFGVQPDQLLLDIIKGVEDRRGAGN